MTSTGHALSNSAPSLITLGWLNIDRLLIRNSNSAGYQWVLDDFSFAAVVPEPGSWLLMLAGCGILGPAVRTTRRSPASSANGPECRATT